jgi:hypothetical protein
MNIELQPELDNQIKQEINSYYKILNVSQQGSLPAFNASKNQILIEIPSDIVFNPSLVTLSFTRGATIAEGTASYYTTFPASYIPYFSSCQLYSSSNNIRLVDIQNLDIYNKMSVGLYDKFSENQDSYLYTSKRSVLTKTALTGDWFIESGTTADRFNSYQAFEMGPSNAVGLAKVINIKMADLCPGSFWSINRNIYSSSILYLRLETNNIKNILFQTQGDYGIFAESLNTSLTINNLSLNVYCEANPDLINIARQQQESKEGLSLVLPEIQNAQYSISSFAGTRGSIVKVVNSSSADARLYMVLSSLTNTNVATNNVNTSNMSNFADAKYNAVQLYINSNQLCNFDTTLNHDLLYIDNLFEKHSFNSLLTYKNLSPFVYVFSTKKIKDNKSDGNLLDGVTYPPNGEITLNITYNCVSSSGATNVPNPNTQSSYNHNIYTITKRKIYLKSGKFSYIPFV